MAVGSDKFQDSQVDNFDVVIDTNIKGLLYVTHEVLKTMVPRNSGHIINIGSVAGQEYYPGGNIYCATKHAVRAISKTLRLDLLGKSKLADVLAKPTEWPSQLGNLDTSVKFKYQWK